MWHVTILDHFWVREVVRASERGGNSLFGQVWDFMIFWWYFPQIWWNCPDPPWTLALVCTLLLIFCKNRNYFWKLQLISPCMSAGNRQKTTFRWCFRALKERFMNLELNFWISVTHWPPPRRYRSIPTGIYPVPNRVVVRRCAPKFQKNGFEQRLRVEPC